MEMEKKLRIDTSEMKMAESKFKLEINNYQKCKFEVVDLKLVIVNLKEEIPLYE